MEQNLEPGPKPGGLWVPKHGPGELLVLACHRKRVLCRTTQVIASSGGYSECNYDLGYFLQTYRYHAWASLSPEDYRRGGEWVRGQLKGDPLYELGHPTLPHLLQMTPKIPWRMRPGHLERVGKKEEYQQRLFAFQQTLGELVSSFDEIISRLEGKPGIAVLLQPLAEARDAARAAVDLSKNDRLQDRSDRWLAAEAAVRGAMLCGTEALISPNPAELAARARACATAARVEIMGARALPRPPCPPPKPIAEIKVVVDNSFWCDPSFW